MEKSLPYQDNDEIHGNSKFKFSTKYHLYLLKPVLCSLFLAHQFILIWECEKKNLMLTFSKSITKKMNWKKISNLVPCDVTKNKEILLSERSTTREPC